MSARGATLQAQVESVLGTLVRAATLELIKLFESRYRASAADGGLAEDNTQSEAWGPPLGGPLGGLWSGDAKRNIGIQVEEDIPPLSELPDPTFLCDGGCLKEPGGVEVVGLTPPELLLDDDEGPVDPDWSPLKEQPVESRNLEAPADKRAPTEDTLHETKSEDSAQSPNASEKPLVIVPGDGAFGEDVKFVCPLILKSESPEKPVEAEPRPACAGTAEGTAYSPSPSDGAATPTRGAAWGRVAAADLLQAKLKLASLDLKLLRPCAVRLVDVLAARPGQRSPRPLPKDLRRHQGPHTGRRLCCFAPGGDGVWRLQTAAAAVDGAPSRASGGGGYSCGVCGKGFRRRKVLRRHERFHTGEKPYACATCSKTFALRKSLRRHQRFHTGERPHACAQCGKSFRLRDNLRAHLRFHTGEKPYRCPTCSKTFRILRNMEKHSLSQCGFFVPSFRTIAGL
ncbi:unnamed protein product [Menidia menidia]|uniref:(Atlantic silverside) hypothetical protein n=1 Tax=Menidia menidia TaxID=238744 RepID=A0A8S4AZE2_9TELE|nr:unnamed protein product [Menidia menidia]